MQKPFSILSERDLFRRADYLATVAHSVRGELCEYGINLERVVVLANGADTAIFHPAEAKSGDDQSEVDYSPHIPLYFITAGRLGLRKGLEDLICSAEILCRQDPQVQFWIAGDGPLKSDLQQRITRLGLSDRILLLGHISDRQKLATLYREALGFIHPAHYEGLPTVLLEAMACGCPVIATAVSGSLDVVQDGVNGLLVPPRAPEAIAAAAVRLIQQPALRRSLGQAASQTIAARYSWEVVGRSYVEWYRRMLVSMQN